MFTYTPLSPPYFLFSPRRDFPLFLKGMAAVGTLAESLKEVLDSGDEKRIAMEVRKPLCSFYANHQSVTCHSFTFTR